MVSLALVAQGLDGAIQLINHYTLLSKPIELSNGLHYSVDKSLSTRYNISNTRKSVSSDIQTLRSGLKNECKPSFFFNQVRSVLISDETLLRVLDIASQSINNS